MTFHHEEISAWYKLWSSDEETVLEERQMTASEAHERNEQLRTNNDGRRWA